MAHDKWDTPRFVVEVVFVIKSVIEVLLAVIRCKYDEGVFTKVVLVEVVHDSTQQSIGVGGKRIVELACFHDDVVVFGIIYAANGFAPIADVVWVFVFEAW